MLQKKVQKKVQKKQNGGDGYVVNVNEAIGGLPAFSRYSNNYRPIFEGDLLQNGGDGYSVDMNKNIGGLPVYDRYTYKNTPVFKGDLTQNGGDGYSVDMNKNIGGLPVYDRYTYKNTPVFKGDLTQNGGAGDGYSVDVNEDIGGLPAYDRYTFKNMPVFEGDLTQNGGDCGCGNQDPNFLNTISMQNGGGNCNCNSNSDPNVFDLIKNQNGGSKKEPITQFHAIREVSYVLIPLKMYSLIELIIKIFLHYLMQIKPKKAKQLGGNVGQLQSVLAPLGKNNLVVLAGLLLLHHFAVESKKPKLLNNKILSGGDPFIQTLGNILAPLGINQLGASVMLVLLQQAFTKKNIKINNLIPQNKNINNLSKNTINKTKDTTNKNRDTSNKLLTSKKTNLKILSGGNPLKELIAPLGTNAFIATGLLIILEKMITSKVNEVKNNKNLKGGSNTSNKNFERLFNVIAPITFNTFAKKSFLEKMVNEKIIKEKMSKK